MGPITLNNGAISPVRSGDEGAPGLPDGALFLNPHFGSLGFSSDSYDMQEYGDRAPCGQTPTRAADKPDTPPSRRPRADSQHAEDVGDEGFLLRRQIPASAAPSSVLAPGRVI